jgi:hypothetical protein
MMHEMSMVYVDITAEHGTLNLPPGLTMETLANYMLGACILRSGRSCIPDAINPEAERIANIVYTDGEWVWRLSDLEYAQRYGIPLPRTFLDHVSSLGVPPATLTSDQIAAALALLRQA